MPSRAATSEIDFDEQRAARGNKVAQEYQVVYSVELDERGLGMEQYSPLWQFNFVVVPRDYEPNTLRSEADCRESGRPDREEHDRRELTGCSERRRERRPRRAQSSVLPT
jgi:hypothetical protein